MAKWAKCIIPARVSLPTCPPRSKQRATIRSLSIAVACRNCLQVTAELEDGTIMGLQHKTLPIHGVQFHPESIASEHGHHLMRNFLDMAKELA